MFTYVCPSVTSLLGYTQEEFLCAYDTYLTEHPLNQVVVDSTRRAILGEMRPPYFLELYHKNGSKQRLKIYERPVCDADGNVCCIQGIAEYVTQQQHIHDALQQQEVLFRRTQKMAQIGMWRLDLDDNHLEWSEEIYRIFEMNPLNFDASYEAFLKAIHPDDRESVHLAYRQSLENKSPYEIRHRLLMPDGRIKHVLEACETVFDHAGNPVTSYGTVQDITKMVQLEEEKETNRRLLFQQSKMAQMGEMLSMIAHQWRQPLAAISATVNSLMLKNVSGKYDLDYFDQRLHNIADFSQHLSQTIDDFRHFFKSDKTKERTTLETIAQSAIAILQNALTQHGIRLETDFRHHRPIDTYANELKQVVLNLIMNAEDALLERHVTSPVITLRTGDEYGNPLLVVEDNAGGIDQALIQKIFDPYFSTKLEKEGTGLGLYMSKTIVEEHCSGLLRVSNGKAGAKFEIVLNP